MRDQYSITGLYIHLKSTVRIKQADIVAIMATFGIILAVMVIFHNILEYLFRYYPLRKPINAAYLDSYKYSKAVGDEDGNINEANDESGSYTYIYEYR